ncbi:MAG: 6-phosphogluconolactonase [Bacteroidota bacterium]|jgi:6-phosphogluconolactonase
MANEIKYSHFGERNKLFDRLAGDITADILSSLELKGTCNILLSGGSTPKPVYERIAGALDTLEQIHWGLVDERFVGVESEYSNERMIKEALGKDADVVGLVRDLNDRSQNLKKAEEFYESFLFDTDITVLGMGTDGHTASIFPGDPISEELRLNNKVGIENTSAPNFPKERITCTPELICNSRKIYLLITGEEKLHVLSDVNLKLPIHDIFKKRQDILVYYAD